MTFQIVTGLQGYRLPVPVVLVVVVVLVGCVDEVVLLLLEVEAGEAEEPLAVVTVVVVEGSNLRQLLLYTMKIMTKMISLPTLI